MLSSFWNCVWHCKFGQRDVWARKNRPLRVRSAKFPAVQAHTHSVTAQALIVEHHLAMNSNTTCMH